MGSLYQRKQRDGSKGGPWWAKYRDAEGNLIRVSTESEVHKQAKEWLAIREGKAASGEKVPTGRLTWQELREMLLTYYRSSGKRDVVEAMTRIRHLDRHFNGWRVDRITPDAIAQYVVKRQAEAIISPVKKNKKYPANGTINREIATISRALTLAVKYRRLAQVPAGIERLKEAAPRKGFFEVGVFNAIRERLPLDLQVAVSMAYDLGWRTQSEVLPLELHQVNLAGERGSINLDPGTTKNDDARVVYLTIELTERLRDHVERVKELARSRGEVPRWLFPIFPGKHILARLVGRQRQDFKRAWKTASRAAGYPNSIRHDFRRTAVRAMEQAGVPRSVATKITGHKTENVYRRYAIVSPADLKRAASQLETSREVLGTTTGHNGQVRELRPKRKDGTTGT